MRRNQFGDDTQALNKANAIFDPTKPHGPAGVLAWIGGGPVRVGTLLRRISDGLTVRVTGTSFDRIVAVKVTAGTSHEVFYRLPNDSLHNWSIADPSPLHDRPSKGFGHGQSPESLPQVQ